MLPKDILNKAQRLLKEDKAADIDDELTQLGVPLDIFQWVEPGENYQKEEAKSYKGYPKVCPECGTEIKTPTGLIHKGEEYCSNDCMGRVIDWENDVPSKPGQEDMFPKYASEVPPENY